MSPGCSGEDQFKWCITLNPWECYRNDDVCCETCKRFHIGIPGESRVLYFKDDGDDDDDDNDDDDDDDDDGDDNDDDIFDPTRFLLEIGMSNRRKHTCTMVA